MPNASVSSETPSRPRFARGVNAAFLTAASASGAFWWWVANGLAPGAVGMGRPSLDLTAAVITGLLVGLACRPVYRSLPLGHLLWLAPVSLYLAAAAHLAIAFILKLAIFGRDVVGTSWSPGSGPTVHLEGPVHLYERIAATWLGISLPFYLAVLLPLAFVNHFGLWVIGAHTTSRGAGSDATS